MRFLAITFIVCLLLSACSKENFNQGESVSDQFQITFKEAITPIWVRGNTSSGHILVYVQGGPGYNTLDFATVDYPGWRETLEKDYAVAYYDQLGTGMRQGKVDPASVTIDDWIEQLHAVGTVLSQKYQTKITFLGHSFGGVLVMRYLLRYHENGVADYYINMNGPATTDVDTIRWGFRRDFLDEMATEQIKLQNDLTFWKEVQTWLSQHPTLTTKEERMQWNRYVEDNYDKHFDDKLPGFRDYAKVLFASSYSLGPAILNGKSLDILTEHLIEEDKAFELIHHLGEIKEPMLLITGNMDDICPPQELKYMYDHLGGTLDSVIIPEAGHDAYLHQPELFRDAIRSYIK